MEAAEAWNGQRGARPEVEKGGAHALEEFEDHKARSKLL